ncbi:uncharacterized protein PHACADRAFT_257609 [Phanerochaete carnosa HHB-10118-sp]|uniref:Uncharacterized protein n=1 Tax=Phanerochaete carnosa (strain HHB-10118-sp) TaxID=650164 RepID=K5VRC1_PHACS|nr:uncharacterized protein PHACADRAFT_257609 [Phanerochaete carnosa HHB-10118-sp]EKM54028.1 hypothetical protein PHACADRAFT_257609 [Phanerochaete carnosa HHB-10118-sp]
MCHGENNAPHATSYLNAQLQALWKISSECVEHHGTYLKPDLNYRYSFALAEYYYGKHRSGAQAAVDDMWFHAKFQAPTLDFLCNHEALVQINIDEGHFNSEHARASDTTAADRFRNLTVSETSATFRVPFKMTGIKGRDTIIGSSENVINMLVFDYKSAVLIDTAPKRQERERQSLEIYLRTYLQFLQAAGHHVLFSLPDFNIENPNVLIDFSQAARVLLNISEVQGISIEQINRFLSTSWLKAAMLAGAQNGLPVDRPAISLAEYRSTWVLRDENIHFHLKFGAPQVAALCNDEILLYFLVDEALFYDGEDFQVAPIKNFYDWKVAVLFNVIRESEDEGKVIRCKIDVQSSRYMQQFSVFEGCVESDEDDLHCMNHVISFITGEYLNVLENAQYHIIYHFDARWPKIGSIFDEQQTDEVEIDAEWSRNEVTEDGRTASKTAIWRDITQKSDMYGFDQITALSQAAINMYYRSIWTQVQASASTSVAETLVFQWKFEDYFEAEFKPPTVRLREDGRAIVFLHIKRGFLKPLRNWAPYPDGDKFEFEDWRIAFEADLKMCDHSALTEIGPEWQTAFKKSRVYEQYGTSEIVDFKHIYLDFQNVTFLHESSRFDGLFTAQNKRSIDKVQAAVVYLRDYYLKQLVSAGHHVLYTIPVLSRPSAELYQCLTSVVFHIYSKKISSEYNWNEQSRASEPIIIILGMCGGRPMPASVLQYSTEWVVRAGRFSSYGTAAISGGLFLRERLLRRLSEINTRTTVIPRFSGIERDTWKLKLSCWSDHPERQNENCVFTLDPGSRADGSLRYFWQHHDKYNYEHRGGNYIMTGQYSVACITQNYLEIPTTFKHGTMEIKLGGTVSIEVFVNTSSAWRSSSTAVWQASIAVHSEANGLKVSSVRSQTQFTRPNTEGETYTSLALDPEALLRSVIPSSIDLTEAMEELKIFEQAWYSCYPGMGAYNLVQPVFNSKGDLLFELQARTATAATTVGAPSSSPTSKFKPKHDNRNRAPARPGLQPTYSSRDGSSSHSRQPSFEHLHVDTGSTQIRQSFSRSSAGGGLSAEPGSLSAGVSPYPNMPSSTSPMGPPFSQSPQFEDYTTNINGLRSPPLINRPMSSAGSRPASSMANNVRATPPQNGPYSFNGTSTYSMSPPQQHEIPSDGVHFRTTTPSAGQRNFDSGSVRVHVTGGGQGNNVPDIRVTDTVAGPRGQTFSSFPQFAGNSFQQPTPMAAPRPTSAAGMQYRMSGTASGRATPVTQHQTGSADISSPEGRRAMREGMRQEAFGMSAGAGAFDNAAGFSGFPGTEYRSSSRMSSRGGMMSGGGSSMSGGGSFQASGRYGDFSPVDFTQVSVVE